MPELPEVENNEVDPGNGIYTVKKYAKYKISNKKSKKVKKQTQVNRIRKSKYKNAVKQMDLLINSKDKAKAKKNFSKISINSNAGC